MQEEIDKNDTHYFIATMSQAEFEKLIGVDKSVPPYKFNMVRKAIHGRNPMNSKELEEINTCIDAIFEKVADIEETVEEINERLRILDLSNLEMLMSKIEKSIAVIESHLQESNEKFFDSVTRNTTKLSNMINEYKGFIAIERAKTAKFNAAIRATIEKLSEE